MILVEIYNKSEVSTLSFNNNLISIPFNNKPISFPPRQTTNQPYSHLIKQQNNLSSQARIITFDMCIKAEGKVVILVEIYDKSEVFTLSFNNNLISASFNNKPSVFPPSLTTNQLYFHPVKQQTNFISAPYNNKTTLFPPHQTTKKPSI